MRIQLELEMMANVLQKAIPQNPVHKAPKLLFGLFSSELEKCSCMSVIIPDYSRYFLMPTMLIRVCKKKKKQKKQPPHNQTKSTPPPRFWGFVLCVWRHPFLRIMKPPSSLHTLICWVTLPMSQTKLADLAAGNKTTVTVSSSNTANFQNSINHLNVFSFYSTFFKKMPYCKVYCKVKSETQRTWAISEHLFWYKVVTGLPKKKSYPK